MVLSCSQLIAPSTIPVAQLFPRPASSNGVIPPVRHVLCFHNAVVLYSVWYYYSKLWRPVPPRMGVALATSHVDLANWTKTTNIFRSKSSSYGLLYSISSKMDTDHEGLSGIVIVAVFEKCQLQLLATIHYLPQYFTGLRKSLVFPSFEPRSNTQALNMQVTCNIHQNVKDEFS